MIVHCYAGCNRDFDIPVTGEQIKKWQNGMLIQTAMPELSPDQRELLISQTCSDCWDAMFQDDYDDTLEIERDLE